jgi:AcrR family transcriptional regulator
MSEETRERILRAAEVLFARDGYAATSLRQITDTAGVNIASVNYHFGSKENLLTEILDRVVGPINAERLDLLDAAQAEGIPDVNEVLTAFLLPDLHVLHELRARDPELPRFVSRMYTEGSGLMEQVMGRQFAETQRRFYAAFQVALPDLGANEIGWRLGCVVGIIVYLFAGVEARGMSSMIGPDPEKDLAWLLSVTVPLMTAPAMEVVYG